MSVIKAIYNFIVGDMIILVGVLLTLALLLLVNTIEALAPLRPGAGVFLILAVIAILTASLYRETRPGK